MHHCEPFQCSSNAWESRREPPTTQMSFRESAVTALKSFSYTNPVVLVKMHPFSAIPPVPGSRRSEPRSRSIAPTTPPTIRPPPPPLTTPTNPLPHHYYPICASRL